MATTGPDLVLVAYAALDPDEQEEVFEALEEARRREEAGNESQTGRLIRFLVRAAEETGHEPTPDDYRTVRKQLLAHGEEIAPFGQVVRHFGSWRRAKEAATLSRDVSARRIEARFRSRRLGKVWRYTEEMLRETLDRCVDDLGHVPQVAEFDWWRQREFELARAQGNDALHLPSAGPYRRRWGSWEAALLRLGFSPDQVEERLERP